MADLQPVPALTTASDLGSAAVALDVTGADIPGEAITLREKGPLVRVVLPGDVPAWAVTDAEVLKELFTDWRVSKDAHQHWPRFRAGQVPSDWPLITWISVRNMFTAYGKDHRRLRKLIGPAFTPRRVTALRPQIKRIVTDLLDDLAARPVGTLVDLREDYATQVPLRVITALMGVPDDLQPRLRVCVDEIFSTTPQRDPHDTFTELVSLLSMLVERRRGEPGEDMTSLLIDHRDNGDRLSEEELVHTLLLVISAGYETTVNLIDQAIHQVLSRPGLLGQLRIGAVTWSQLVEETLRYAPPVANLPLRYAIADIDIADVQVKAGEAIIAAIAAANRNPDRHEPNPDAFDPTRPNKEHLSFGYGSHHCLGAALARLEAVEALPALFGRFPELTYAVDADELTPLPSFISHGHQSLPVHLDRPRGTSARRRSHRQ